MSDTPCDYCGLPIPRARRNQHYHPACRLAVNLVRINAWKARKKFERENYTPDKLNRDEIFDELDRLIAAGLGSMPGLEARAAFAAMRRGEVVRVGEELSA